MKHLLFALVLASATAVSAQERMIAPPPSGNVTLPLEEYNRLLALASKPPRKTDAPGLNYVVKHAELKLRVPGETVLGTVQLDGETFTKAAVKVPLVTGMTILDARLEGKPLPLQSEGPAHTAVLPGASDFAVTLEAGLPLAIDAGRASFSLPVPAAGSARLTLVVPGDHTNVRLSPGLITARNSVNGQTTVEATLVPGQPATIWWTTREVSAPAVPREVRFLSNVKTLVSVSESDLRIAALADITVVQGEPSQFVIALPAGYELTSATGASLDSSEVQSGSPFNSLVLKLAAGNQKSYQFLISLEKSISATKVDVPFLTFKDTQRETGEILVEGGGTIELTAKEAGGLKRLDVKEVNPYLRSLVRFPMQAAFRYHKQPSESPALALEWVRFPDSSVLAAVAERAVITTLVTSEGKSLTEVKLTVRNQAQPFLKVALPQGASILSAEVAGEKVKPVQGADGNRVPLLRPNFRPSGSYEVSFVFMHSGTPFAKKGGSELSLPKMDVPINLMQWEVFLPEQYKVKDFGGDAIAANLVPASFSFDGTGASWLAAPATPVASAKASFRPISLLTGQIGGYVTDLSGATVGNAQVTVQQLDFGVTRTATSDAEGRWVVSSIPSGRVRVTVKATGFSTMVRDGSYEADRPSEMDAALNIGAVNEAVTVSVASAPIDTSLSQIGRVMNDKKAKQEPQRQELAPSVNVSNFQRRVAGVLPIAVDVPHAGNSYRFVRPLVLDEETKVTFTYKTK
jgi:hypothetical protein